MSLTTKVLYLIALFACVFLITTSEDYLLVELGKSLAIIVCLILRRTMQPTNLQNNN